MKITVYIQPSAKKAGYAGLYDNMPKIKITAPPVDGAANSEIIKIFAKLLNIAKTNVEIVSELSSRTKILDINADITYEEILKKIEKF